jgi:hypothetical protein
MRKNRVRPDDIYIKEVKAKFLGPRGWTWPVHPRYTILAFGFVLCILLLIVDWIIGWIPNNPRLTIWSLSFAFLFTQLVGKLTSSEVQIRDVKQMIRNERKLPKRTMPQRMTHKASVVKTNLRPEVAKRVHLRPIKYLRYRMYV